MNLFSDVGRISKDSAMQNYCVKNGVYLDAMELQNWGSFSGMFEIPFNSEPSLIVGENGTGKTTLMDGILTLLVTRVRYNNARDNKGKRAEERTLMEYVRGFKESTKETGVKKVQYLRQPGEISILLLRFRCGTDFYTIANVFLAEDKKDNPKMFYVFRDGYMSIRENFVFNANTFEDYRSAIGRQEGIVVTADRKKYFDFIRSNIGLVDNKSMDLLRSMSSEKNLDDLDTVIRNYMFLDRKDFLADFERTNEELKVVVALQKDVEEKMERNKILSSLIPYINDARAKVKECDVLSASKDKVRPYLFRFAKQAQEEEIIKLQSSLEDVERKRKKEQASKDSLIETKAALVVERDNKGGLAIAQKNLELEHLYSEKRVASRRLEEFESSLGELGIVGAITNAVVLKDIQDKLQKYRKDVSKEYEQCVSDQVKVNDVLREKTNALMSLESEYKKFQLDRVTIPQGLVRVRDEMCQALGIEPLPFLGEYLSVKDKEWLPALEHILFGESSSILVPIELKDKVATYLRTHKGSRENIRFIRMDVVKKQENNDPRIAWKKIAVTENKPYTNWVKEYIRFKAWHICCDTLDEFHSVYPAVTKEGLVNTSKYNGNKDERHDINDPRNFRMSGSYEARLEAFRRDIQQAEENKRKAQKDLVAAKQRFDAVEEKRRLLDAVPAVSGFEMIDVASYDDKIKNCEEAIELLKNNKDLHKIEESIQAVVVKIEKQNEKIAVVDEEWKTKVNRLAVAQSSFEENLALLNDTVFSQEEEELLHTMYEKYRPSSTKSKSVMDVASVISGQITNQFKKVEEERRQFTKTAERLMQSYVDKFVGAKNNLVPTMTDPEEVDRFIEEYRRVRDDALPKAREDFEKAKNEGYLAPLKSLVVSLLHDVDNSIRSVVDTINGILRQVPYTQAPTYLQVGCRRTKNERIVQLREKLDLLSKSKGFLGDADDEAQQETIALFRDFSEYVMKFIPKIKRNGYSKENILDPRNWFEFPISACKLVEHEDGESELVVIKALDEIAKQSGGEGEKLVYFILAACFAMWMHFLDEDYTGKTFRFLLIDEIGGKLTSTNLHDVIVLFSKLHAQMVSLLPLDDKVSRYQGYVGNIVRTDYANNESESFVETITYLDYVNRNNGQLKEMLEAGKKENA